VVSLLSVSGKIANADKNNRNRHLTFTYGPHGDIHRERHADTHTHSDQKGKRWRERERERDREREREKKKKKKKKFTSVPAASG
jgi:hypothetical protein